MKCVLHRVVGKENISWSRVDLPGWRHEGKRHSSVDLNSWQIGRVVWTRQAKVSASSEAKKSLKLTTEVKE